MSETNPYEADPEKIPPTDPYREEPFYGRYLPRPTDFKPEPAHIRSSSPDSVAYWQSVLSQCTVENRIYENETGGRDVFALGSVIVKATHLKQNHGRDYALADANEVAATELARPVLDKLGIKVPQIYFAGKVCKNCCPNVLGSGALIKHVYRFRVGACSCRRESRVWD